MLRPPLRAAWSSWRARTGRDRLFPDLGTVQPTRRLVQDHQSPFSQTHPFLMQTRLPCILAGGSLRPLLRLLQHPHPHLRRRSRLPPRWDASRAAGRPHTRSREAEKPGPSPLSRVVTFHRQATGARGHHPSRREAALRLRRGDRAEGGADQTPSLRKHAPSFTQTPPLLQPVLQETKCRTGAPSPTLRVPVMCR